jgi:deazaflavin-dependent oxidoreductase (nitroreductase family)
MPIWIYRMGLGSLLGTRFLLLTHTGRRSGKSRQNVLEVVRYDNEKNLFLVASGFGPDSDWYQNIRADPNVIVQCQRTRWNMTAIFLTPAEASEELAHYASQHPLAMRELAGFMGYRLDGSEADVHALGNLIPMVEF